MTVINRLRALGLMMLLCFGMQLKAQTDYEKRLKTERVASDGTIVWEQVAPGNAGYANLMRYHPTIAGHVVQCPDMWNIYQSENNGKKWYGITDSDGKGDFNHIRDLDFAYSDAALGLAVCNSELWQSLDTGRSWRIVKNCPWYVAEKDGTDRESWIRKIAAVAIDPQDRNTWFVAGGSNVRGQDWLSCYKDITAKNTHGKKARNEGKLWKTTDAGKHWKLTNKGLHPKTQVGRVVVHPRNKNRVFAASNYGVYRSDDGGENWSNVSEGKLENNIIMDMDFYYNVKTGAFVLYVIDQVQYLPSGKTTKCTGGVYTSADEGKAWVKINGDISLDINRLTGGVPKNYYQYISKWLGISRKEIKSKFPELPRNALQYFNMISADPTRENAVYVGFADPQVANSIMPGRLWATTNNGEKWVNTARLYQETWEKDSAYWKERGNPYDENMKVGHSSPHHRYGKDYALRSTRGIDVGVDGSIMMISDHSTMLSTDHGATWQQMDETYTPSGAIVGNGNSNLPGLTILQDRREELTLLGSGEHNLWIPADDAPEGQQALRFVGNSQETVGCLVTDPYDAKVVYASSNRQSAKQYIFKSTDAGENWKKHGLATPATNKWFDDFYTNALTIDPINNQYMYFGITKIQTPKKGKMGGFFYSEDYGKTFVPRNNGLPSPARINDVQFDPRDETRASLFIAAQKHSHSYHLPLSEGGLYHSSDRGENWTKVNTPKSVEGVNFVLFDHTNRMYITTGYRQKGDGVWCSDDFGATWKQVFTYPGTESIDISPFDHNLLVVTTRFMSLNPGVFVSKNRGKTWRKSNTNITIPHQIEDIKFNLFDPSKMWLATLGCGFYTGVIKDGDKVQVVKVNNAFIHTSKGKKNKLKATIVHPDYMGSKITWKSENPAIATVNRKGVVKARSNGKTKIWATCKNGRFSDYSVVVVKKE